MAIEKHQACNQLKNLDIHLYDLACFCEHLGNKANCKDNDDTICANTETIGSWLKLAAQLDKVDINTWKFSSDSELNCGYASDAVNADMKHYSSYSTLLTKFIFISNALEEMYRFIVPIYKNNNSLTKKGLKKPSMQAAALVDICTDPELPKYFHHILEEFIKSFNSCDDIKRNQLSGMKEVQITDFSYGLHLIRNIRNYVAHGDIPIIITPSWCDDYDRKEALFAVMENTFRVSCLFIQILLNKYNNGMQSDHHKQAIKGIGKEFDYYRENCNPKIALNLHLLNCFSFQ